MAEHERFRVFATSRIGDAAENLLRARGYDLEVFQGPEAPPKKLIIEKLKSGIDGLITTLRDPMEAKVFAAGKSRVKVVAQSLSDSTTLIAPKRTNTKSRLRTPPM